jgi:hypothetical protein
VLKINSFEIKEIVQNMKLGKVIIRNVICLVHNVNAVTRHNFCTVPQHISDGPFYVSENSIFTVLFISFLVFFHYFIQWDISSVNK